MVRTVRPPLDDVEIKRLDPVVDAAFGVPIGSGKPDPARDAIYSSLFPYELSTLVLDDAEIVGGCRSTSFDISLPGGRSVPALGLNGVGVYPTRQGRGAFREMMEEHLQMAKDRGAAASVLMASESQLYGRFGYGWASSVCDLRLSLVSPDGRRLFAPDAPTHQQVELLSDLQTEETRKALGGVYNAVAAQRPGMVTRSEAWWQLVLYPGKPTWFGAGDQFCVVTADGSGTVNGYALYALRGNGEPPYHSNDRLEIRIQELMATSVAAELSLWQHLSTVPFAVSALWRFAPTDVLVRHHLNEPRVLEQLSFMDAYWLRALDVVSLLTARSYQTSGGLRFAVDDDLFPDQAGPWELTVDSTGTAAMAPSRDADITISPAQLGALSLGGATARDMQRAGLLSGPGEAVAMLDYLLASPQQPYCPSKF